MILDLKVLREPWRTEIMNRYSWFHHSNLHESTRVLRMVGVTTGFSAVTTGFLLWTLTEENGRERGLTGWTTALDWELARSDSLAAGKELVTGSKVPSDLLQLKSGHSENLDFTRLFFVPSCTTLDVTTYNVVMKIVVRRTSVNLIRRGVNRYPRRCKSFYNGQSTLLTLTLEYTIASCKEQKDG